MATRSETPGLIRRRRKGGEALYWSAKNLARSLEGFPDPLIALPPSATVEEIRDLCETYSARLSLWLAGEARPRWLYDGTVGSLCDAYERHPESPIHEVKANTADSYRDSMKILRATVARRAVRALTPVDVKRWYRLWREPAAPGRPERVDRAHNAVAQLRAILRFGFALGHDECGILAKRLAVVQFGRSAPRTSEMTLGQARALIAASLARADRRGRSMAIGVAMQFETMLRQKDVIGEWNRDIRSAPAGAMVYGAEAWSGAFTWENIPGGLFRMTTSKTGAPALFDLTRLDMLWPLLQMVPQAERTGAIVTGDEGHPIRERSYRKWFREIARTAGVPDNVWNMDARAGAVTEALESGAQLEDVQRAATHSHSATTLGYERRVESSISAIATARKKARLNEAG
jgi:hypothetical protein